MRKNKLLESLEDVYLPERPTYHANTLGWKSLPFEESIESRGRVQLLSSTVDRLCKVAPLQKQVWTPNTIFDFHQAYIRGETTPSEVVERVIQAIEESKDMEIVLSYLADEMRQQADMATERFRVKRPISVLDGVPFTVKDLIDCPPYSTSCGTSFMATRRRATMANPGVQRMLDLGAIMIGKVNTHEIGLGTTGLNTRTGTARNPHNRRYHTGGSSSGGGAAVACGLCPCSIGTDGGGSIRIPAALCGVIGLMPTHERVSMEHCAPIDQTVATSGPLAGTVLDAALMYLALAESSKEYPTTIPKSINVLSAKPLEGLTFGIYVPWFEDCDKDILELCQTAVAHLQSLGATKKEVIIPELHMLRAAHTCTILSEMRNSMQAALNCSCTRQQFNLETRASLAIAGVFTGAHYVQSQKIRTRLEIHFRKVFDIVDIICTPTTPVAAPIIRENALQSGVSDLVQTAMLMRYVLAPNMLGLTALTLPVGIVEDSLPVGLQLIAPPWNESSLLHIGATLEEKIAFHKKPEVYFDVLHP